MGQLRSKWPGKCKICGAKHEAGGIVWWESGQKGVKCLKCTYKLDDLPDLPPLPTPDSEEDDELKKAQPTTLRRGHLVSATRETLFAILGCGVHDFDKCECPGCFMRRGGTPGMREVGWGTSPTIVIESQLLREGPFLLFPGASIEDQIIHTKDGCPFYWVRFSFIDNNDARINKSMKVPLHYITNGSIRIIGGSDMRIVGSDTTIAKILYTNGVYHDRLRHTTPEASMVPSPGYKILRSKALTHENRSLFIGTSLTVVTDALGNPMSGCARYHNGKCDCQECRLAAEIARPQIGDTFVVGKCLPDGSRSQLFLEKCDDSGRLTRVCIHVNWTLRSEEIIARHGLAFSALPDALLDEEFTPEPSPIIIAAKDSPEKETPVVTQNLNEAATALLAVLQSSAVNEAKVREIALDTVASELKKLPIKNHKIKFNDGVPLEFDGILHGMATEIAEAIVSGFHNIMVVGPAGSGKTYLFSQVSDILKTQMKWEDTDYKASMSCAPGQTESMFIGRMIPSLTTGTEKYHGTNLTRLYSKECGGSFLFDEISNSEPTVMNLVNSMIALDGHVTLPDGRVLERPKNMVIFAADNTWGQGGDRMYIRNQLDAATLDRFTGAKFFMDYDDKLELALCPDKEVYDAITALRKKVSELKLRRIVSTRAFAAAHRMGSNGMKIKDIVKRLTIDWSENDRKSVGA